MPPLVTLRTGTAKCTICPDVGGSIVSWSIDGQDMLRRADATAITSVDPLRFASFPLVPFSNRIAEGKFEWNGQRIEIELNFRPERHPIHGLGWQRPWLITEQSDTHCVLELSHKPDSRWHWPFSAKQTITLAENSLNIELEAGNLCEKPVPLAFGHHPYFDRCGAYLAFDAKQIFLCDADGLPTECLPPTAELDFSHGERVEGRCIDNCYSGWDGEARIIWEDRPLGLVITSDMPAAVVYIPKQGDAFCFEPVPHINNALNRPDVEPAMPIIQPGDSFRSRITMSAIASEHI